MHSYSMGGVSLHFIATSDDAGAAQVGPHPGTCSAAADLLQQLTKDSPDVLKQACGSRFSCILVLLGVVDRTCARLLVTGAGGSARTLLLACTTGFLLRTHCTPRAGGRATTHKERAHLFGRAAS